MHQYTKGTYAVPIFWRWTKKLPSDYVSSMRPIELKAIKFKGMFFPVYIPASLFLVWLAKQSYVSFRNPYNSVIFTMDLTMLLFLSICKLNFYDNFMK